MYDFEEAIVIIDRNKDTCEILCPHCETWMHESLKYSTRLIRRCPHCNKIFYLPVGWTCSIANPMRQCMFCGGWVRLF